MSERDFLSLFSKLSPERTQAMGRMAQLICEVADFQPIGRRSVAWHLSITEREVRSIADELKAQGFLDADASGMKLSPAAAELLPACRELSRRLFSISEIEQQLCRLLNAESVTVVTGSAGDDPRVIQDVGRAAARKLKEYLHRSSILAVGGGSAMAETARGLHPASLEDLMVVPLRGGIGPLMEDQASMIAAEIATKLGGHYRLMHLPETIGQEAARELLAQEDVRKTLELIRRADVVMHGIGRADEMAQKRSLPETVRALLHEQGAVGEAFGEFFDQDGKTIYHAETFGADVLKASEERRVIAVAAGARKAQAIVACMKREKRATLICDEGAANAILSTLQTESGFPGESREK